MSQNGLSDRFADGKDAAALRTIGEVAKALGIRQHVLRYWEEQFPVLKPLKRSGGRRYYRPEDIALVESIDRLVHREGYTLKGARKALQGGAAKAVEDAAPAVSAPPPAPHLLAAGSNAFAYRARLISLRTTLVNALHEG
jgi:DNA-binding transcriptional MerR regulator